MNIAASCSIPPQGSSSTLRPPLPGPPSEEIRIPLPETLRLSNGLSVWLLPSREVPLVTLSVVVRAGSASDPAGKEGLASLTADMLDEGAGAHGPLEIADLVDFLGAELSTSAQKELSEVSLEVLSRNLEPALDIVADVLLRPALSENEWARVKALALNDLAQRREEPREVARVVSERVFFGDSHPYGHPLDGYESTVKALRLDDVKTFYRTHYRPELATLIVAGDVTAADLRDRLERRFGTWRGDGPAPAPPRATSLPSTAPRLVIVDKPEAPQTEIRILLPAPAFTSPATAPLTLANTVLGGTFTSRLVTNLRERNKFTYGASSILPARGMPAHLTAGSAVHSVKTGAALVELCREFRAMETGKFEPGELEKPRSTHWSRTVEALESQEGTLDLYRPLAALGLPPEARREFHRRLATAPAEEVSARSREVFRWSAATIVLVGDRSLIEKQLLELAANPPTDASGAPCAFPAPAVLGRDGEPMGDPGAIK
jgi:zinc protease